MYAQHARELDVDGEIVLPTYVFPLAIEICHTIASYLHHPVTAVRNRAAWQQAFVVRRAQHSLNMLENLFPLVDDPYMRNKFLHDIATLRTVVRNLKKHSLCPAMAAAVTRDMALPFMAGLCVVPLHEIIITLAKFAKSAPLPWWHGNFTAHVDSRA